MLATVSKHNGDKLGEQNVDDGSNMMLIKKSVAVHPYHGADSDILLW
jgi:hypothetical protein